ncbi:MAG: manganese efflux pump [Clostridia bacterium]|nr:manganese efflux pump [Clostridia bacterium]
MTAFLILTSLTVSIDSFVCGFSLSMSNGKKLPVILGIALTVFLMCLITNYSAGFFSAFLNEKSTSLGGILLIMIGVVNLLKKDKDTTIKNNKVLAQSVVIGFAVGLDGALANLSLAIMGINMFYVPMTIAITHALMISLGVLLSRTNIAKRFGKIRFLPPLILIVLGLYKITGLLF